MDLPINRDNISLVGIFINNLTIGVLLIFFTSLVSYPIILFNGFFLGLNIFFAVQLFGLEKTLLTLTFHTPLEIFGWILCVIASKRMLTFYKGILKKQFNQELLIYIFKFLGVIILIYLLAAIIEYNVFLLLGGSQWLH